MNRHTCNHSSFLRLMSSWQARTWLVYGAVATTFGILAIASVPSASGQAPGTPSPASMPPSVAQSIDRPTLNIGSQGEQVRELQAILKLLGFYAGAVDGLYQEATAIAVAAFQSAAGLPSDGIVNAATWNRLLPPAVAQSNSTASPSNASAFPSPSAAPTAFPSATPTAFPSPSAAATSVSPSTPAATSSSSPTSNSTPAPTPTPASSETSRPSDRPSESEAAPRPAERSTSDRAQFVELPVLRVGMRGAAIVRLQERLRTLGFFNGVIDGIFGQETEAAVQAFQRRHRLDPDGIVGSATWTALLQ